MKLNKKGFGVAEMAIVILLIGILAAAVIVGFMGITKQAESAATSQVEIEKELINATKHAYPTILSGPISGLEIAVGEYEVYEMGSGSIYQGSGDCAVVNNGTLFIKGNGTLDTEHVIFGKSSKNTSIANHRSAFSNNGTLVLSDLVIFAGQQKASGKSNAACYAEGGTTTLNNVVINAYNSAVWATGGIVTIDGPNTKLSNIYTTRTGGHLITIQAVCEVNVKDGLLIARNGNSWCWNHAGTLTIDGGTFNTDNIQSTDPYTGLKSQIGALKYGFLISGGGVVNINGGVFQLNNTETMFQFYNVGSQYPFKGTITITGGEFKKSYYNQIPNTFAVDVDKANGRILEIKDDPNDGTEQLIFHYAPYKANGTNVWGDYVAEGYEWYKFDGKNLWGVRPKAS